MSNPELRRLVDARLWALGLGKAPGEQRLARPSGELGLAQVRRMSAGAGEKSWLALDLGFGVPGSVLEGYRDGAIVSVGSGSRLKLTARPELSSPTWNYAAILERVVDGDTLLVQVQLGLETYSRQRLRLREVNAPELGTTEGDAAAAGLSERLKGCRLLLLRTHGVDMYHRYVADVLYQKREVSPERLREQGRYLNQELLDAEPGPGEAE